MNCEFLIMNYEFLFIQSTNYNHERHQLYSLYFGYFCLFNNHKLLYNYQYIAT